VTIGVKICFMNMYRLYPKFTSAKDLYLYRFKKFLVIFMTIAVVLLVGGLFFTLIGSGELFITKAIEWLPIYPIFIIFGFFTTVFVPTEIKYDSYFEFKDDNILLDNIEVTVISASIIKPFNFMVVDLLSESKPIRFIVDNKELFEILKSKKKS
jgi:hypothetical protein